MLAGQRNFKPTKTIALCQEEVKMVTKTATGMVAVEVAEEDNKGRPTW